MIAEHGGDLRLTLLAQVGGQGAPEEVHAAHQAETLAGFVELGDQAGLQAQRQALVVDRGAVVIGGAARVRANGRAALLRLPQVAAAI